VVSLAALAALATCLGVREARAQEPAAAVTAAPATPRIALEVRGDCPAREGVRAALEPRLQVVEAGAPAWRLTVERQGRAIRMVLFDPPGQQALERILESEDCPALGQAVAFIVDAQLVQLRLLPARLEKAPGWAQGPPVSATADRPLPTVPAAETAAGAPGGGALTLGFGGGLALGLGGGPSAAVPGGVGQVDVAYTPASQSFLVRLAVSVAGPLTEVVPSSLPQQGSSFTLVPVVMRLDAGIRRGTGRFFGQVTGLVGLLLLPSLTTTTFVDSLSHGVDPTLVLGASLAGGVRLSPRWALRLEVAAEISTAVRNRQFCQGLACDPKNPNASVTTLTTDPQVIFPVFLSLEASWQL
jgi:hypothetical protein